MNLANQMRELADISNENILNSIIESIKKEASKGNYKYITYLGINNIENISNYLVSEGFKVESIFDDYQGNFEISIGWED